MGSMFIDLIWSLFAIVILGILALIVLGAIWPLVDQYCYGFIIFTVALLWLKNRSKE